MLVVPDVVQNRARAMGAAHWLADLPAIVDDLAESWGLTVGRMYDGGTEAFVIDATTPDGTLAVLKVLIPREGDSVEHEITVLQLVDGEGCARLLAHDLERSALLLERLGPSLFDLKVPVGRRHEILCDTAARVWRPVPDAGFRTGAEKGRWLIEFITSTWEEVGRPCSERAVDYAIECAERRIAAHDDERAVLVHGDVHEWNALQTLDDPDRFKLVDPDGLLADAEYDLGVIMREDPVELVQGDPWDRARWLAARTGLDVDAIWEWGVVERVSTGLVCAKIDLQPVGAQMLRAAEVVVA